MKKTIICALFTLSLCIPAQKVWAQNPTAPTNFNASTITDTSITLTWDAVTDSTADGYIILTGTNAIIPADGTPPASSTTTLNSETSSTHTVSELTPETLYTFTIASYSFRGNSPTYSYSTGATISDTTLAAANDTTLVVANDTISPSILSINASPNPFLVTNNMLTVVARFNEPMNTNSFPSFSFSQGTWSSSALSWTDDSTFRAVFSYSTEEGHEGTVNVVMTSQDLEDIAGNALELGDTPSTSFNIDTKRPTAVITLSLAVVNTISSTLTITATYNENMNQTILPVFAFNKSGGNFTFNSSTSRWASATVYNAVYDYNTNNTEITNNVMITVTEARDSTGSGNTQQSANSQPFSINTRVPTASISYSDTDKTVRDGENLTITATLSEPIKDDSTLRISINIGGTINLVSSADMTKTTTTLYTYSFTSNSNGANGTATITLSNARNSGNNPITPTPTSGKSFTIDNTAPTISTLTPNNGALNIATNTDLDITFSELVRKVVGKNVVLYDSESSVPVATFSLTNEGNDNGTTTLSFTPINTLEQGKKYYVSIPSDALNDLAGNTFAGLSTTSEWSFTTFAPPEITTVTLSGNSNAACIGDTISIEGNFFTGVTSVRFGNNTNGGAASSNSLILESDSSLKVVVPANAQAGKIYLIKAANTNNNGNPEATVSTQADIEIGPRSAVLSTGSKTIENVCNEGSILSTLVKVTIAEGKSDYTVRYEVKATTSAGEEKTEKKTKNNYKSQEDIAIQPHENNATHIISLIEVKDSNDCAVPSDSLSGTFSVRRNTRPTVSAGGSNAEPNEVSICLGPRQGSITLDQATLGTAPSYAGSTGIQWTGEGSGNIVDQTSLTPTYNLVNGDILAGKVSFEIKSSGVPNGCEAVTDKITIKFSSQPIANSGGETGVLSHCWDGSSTNIQVPLNGSVSGAQSYEWATVATTGGVFSDDTIASPTYTFGTDERNEREAKVTLTATNGTCGGGQATDNRSVADTLTIRLVSPPINSFSNPTKTDVCMDETVIYALENQRSSSRFSWKTKNGSINGSTSAIVKWGSSPGQDTLSVIETDEHGCNAPPLEKAITIHDSTNPGIEGTIFSYGNQENPVELKPKKGVMGKTVEFFGEGVFSVADNEIKKYYFDPGNFWNLKGAGQNNNLQEISIVTYKYKIDIANCYSESLTQDFTVYDANQAFTLSLVSESDPKKIFSLNSDGKYEVCRDQPIKIAISKAFNIARPLILGHQFKGFTLDQPDSVAKLGDGDGPFVNIPSTLGSDTAAHALEWTVILYPKRLRRESETNPTVSEIEINGWQFEGAGDIRTPPPGYGKILIIINDIPTLSYDATPEGVCSNDSPIQLTKNEASNPGRNYRFFSSTANFITGNDTTGFFLKPDATELFTDTSNYPIPTKKTVSYTYEDIKGCSDTTSFDIIIVKTPSTPIVDNFGDEGNPALCVINGKIPTATVNNTASYTYTPEGETEETENAAVRWYSESNLESSTFLEETEAYTPDTEEGNEEININRNGITDYYVTQGIEGCISDPFKVSYEVLNTPLFSWNKSCISDKTKFSVDLGSTPLKKLIWEVQENETIIKVEDTINVSGKKLFSHTFSKLGQDTVIMTVNSTFNCSTSRTQLVTMLNDITVDPTAAYLESFNQDDGGFVALAAPNSHGKTSTWKHGEMGADKNNRPTRVEDTKVWATSLNGPYGNGERSYLYVGCVDLSKTESPLLAFDSWVNVNAGNDGAVLQYSTDGKVINDPSKVWRAVGGINSGVNWYDRTLIESIPNTAVNNYGWSSENTNWQSSKHTLQTIKYEQIHDTIPIIFRFTFAASIGAEKNHGGLALDNLRIGEKKRVVLLENFTNKGSSVNKAAEKSQSDEIKKLLPNSVGKQLVIINYHVGFPSSDPFNLDNPGGPSARALYYGIQTTPTAVLDGSVAPDNDNNGKADLFKLWGERANDLRSLDPSQAEMEIEMNEPGNQERVSVEVSITPLENIEEAKLYIAILEKKVAKNSLPTDRQDMIATEEDTLEYVFKEMLPSSAGVYIGMLQQQEAYKFGPYDWYPTFSKIYSENIAIVAFLQNDKTKNVYQAAFKDSIKLPAVITATEESNPIDYVKVYPNPADKSIHISLPYQAQSNTYTHLIGPMGRVVKDVVVPRGKTTQQIDTQLLAEGIYVLKIKSEKGTSTYKKIVIAHNDK